MTEGQRLQMIRTQLGALDGADWQLASAGEGMQLDALGRDGSRVTIARFCTHASADEMQFVAGAPAHVSFLLGLVDRALRFASRTASQAAPAGAPAGRGEGPDARSGLPPAAERKPDYAAEAAMKCAEPAFKKFLIERHGLESPATTDRAAQKLRSLLGVTSRREINHDARAADAWRALRGEFENWRRGP